MISCTCCLPSIYWRDMIWRDKLTELNRQTQRPLARRSPLDLHRWEKQIQERPRRMRRLGHKKRRHIGLQTSPQFSPILSTTLLFSSAIFQFARSEQRDVESMWAIPWRCGHVCIMHYCKQFWFQTFACSDSFSLLNSSILSAWVTLKSAFCILFVAMSWFPPMLSLSSYSHLRYLRTVSIWRPCRMCAWRAPTKPCTSSWGAWAWKHPQAEHVVAARGSTMIPYGALEFGDVFWVWTCVDIWQVKDFIIKLDTIANICHDLSSFYFSMRWMLEVILLRLRQHAADALMHWKGLETILQPTMV